MACYQRALQIRPDYAEAWNNAGLVHAEQHRPDQAIECVRRALAIRPDYAEALQNIGTQYEAKGLLDEALASYRRAVELKPGFATAYNNIGNALLGKGDLDGSMAAYRKALELNPDFTDAFSNLGNLLQTLGRLDEAINSYESALRLSPDSPDAKWNKAFALLLKGDYAEGWKLAESRWLFDDPTRVRRRFSQPLWLGEEPVEGRSILLHHEQGLGDTLQMLRYAPLLAARGARVFVLVPPALVALARAVPGVDRVMTEGDEAPRFDLHCPFMSLPLAFGTMVASVPASVPYLFAADPLVEAWRERLGAPAGRRIGLVWSGSSSHKNDRNRSIPLPLLQPLLAADAEFISLQKEYRPEDAAFMRQSGRIRDFAEGLSDFAQTAALIAALDLVISVDTSVAHLAGGMGKPVWLLLPFAPDYRWMLERADSPWYPTMRLWRQARHGDWTPVIAAVTTALSPASR